MAALVAVVAAPAGCGNEGPDASDGTVAEHETTATSEPRGGQRSHPSGLERACDAATADEAEDQLARVGFNTDSRLAPDPSGTANLSRCRMSGPGAEVEVTHDSAPQARRRYEIRITELAQFSATDRRLAPRPVPGVGAGRLEGYGANWVPKQRRLLSINGGTLQAVHVYARGVADRDLKTAAIALAGEFEKLP